MDDDFYEDDEPIEHIRAILQRPVDAVTAPPRVINEHLWATYGSFVVEYSVVEYSPTDSVHKVRRVALAS